MSDDARKPTRKPTSGKKSSSGKKAGKSGNGALFARIGLYGAVVVVLVGLLLYRYETAAGNNRAATMSAWNEALDAGDGFLRRSQLAAHVVGEPTVGDPVNESDVEGATMHQLYTWRGLFGSYSAAVHFSDGDDPLVEGVKLAE